MKYWNTGNMYASFTLLDKFKHLWNYVQTYLIDSVHGDWYQGGIDKQPCYKTALKGQIWKGTYHNFRALLNCIQSLAPDTIPPPSPENEKIRQVNGSSTFTWSSLKKDNRFIGYNIYLKGKRIAYTPLDSFTLPAGLKGKKLSVTAVNMHGNESEPGKALAL